SNSATASSSPQVASTGPPNACPQQPQRTGPVGKDSLEPNGTSRRRLISAERSSSSVCLVKARSEGMGQLHEPQDPASTATPRGTCPLQSRIRPLREVYPDEATRYQFGRDTRQRHEISAERTSQPSPRQDNHGHTKLPSGRFQLNVAISLAA